MQMWKKLTGHCVIEAVMVGTDWKTDPLLSAMLKNYKDEILIQKTKQRIAVGEYLVKTDCAANYIALPKEFVEAIFSCEEEKIGIYPNGAVCVITEKSDDADDEIIEVLVEGSMEEVFDDNFDLILEKIKGIVNSEGILLDRLMEARAELRRVPSEKRQSSIEWIKKEFEIDIESASLQTRLEAIAARKLAVNKPVMQSPSDFMPNQYEGLPKDEEVPNPVAAPPVAAPMAPPKPKPVFGNPFHNRWNRR